MTIPDILNELIELGKTIDNKKHIDSLYCFGAVSQNEQPAKKCFFLLLITREAVDDEINYFRTSIKFQLEKSTDFFIINHDVNTINQALNNNSQFAFQVLNNALKLWDFADEEKHG